MRASEFLKETKTLYSQLKSFQAPEEQKHIFLFHPVQLATTYSPKQLIRGFEELKVLDEGFQHSLYSLKMIFKGSRDGYIS